MSAHLFEASSAENPSLPAEGQKRGEAGEAVGVVCSKRPVTYCGATPATTLYPAKMSETQKNYASK